MKTIKKLITLYKAPTPWKWRKIGDSVGLFFSLIGGGSIMANYPKFALACWILACAGKAFTNFFVDENQKSPSAQ